MEPNEGAFWDGDVETEGILWGGCVESLIAQSAAGRYLPKDEELNGTVLFLETAEDIPEHWIVEYLLTGFGERGWFDRFSAVLVGRPKAWEFGKPLSPEKKAIYRKKQRETILKVVRQYNHRIPVVQNLDFGHTDPQVALPNGNLVNVSCKEKKIVLNY